MRSGTFDLGPISTPPLHFSELILSSSQPQPRGSQAARLIAVCGEDDAKLIVIGVADSSVQEVFCASFRNLGFEEANVEHATPGGYGPIGELLPGRSVTANTTGPEGAIGYNLNFGGFGGGPGVSLYDSTGPHGMPQEGAYFMGLQEGISAFNGQLVHYTIEQRE